MNLISLSLPHLAAGVILRLLTELEHLSFTSSPQTCLSPFQADKPLFYNISFI